MRIYPLTLSILVLLCVSCRSFEHPARRSAPKLLAVRQTAIERELYEAKGQHFIVATQGVAASHAAREMLDRGGNIVDAAIAASFTISVERPQSTGIGGGGFMLFREAKSGKVYAIDFRERAPLGATQDMFLNQRGEVVPDRSLDGALAVAVPGMVAGLLEIHQKFGRLSREQVLAPAITLAEKGFAVYPYLADALKDRRDVIARFPASAQIFLKNGGQPYRLGEMLVQKDLAQTLRTIAREGARSFYRGPLARKMVRDLRAHGGLISLEDFRKYKVKWREPVRGRFHEYEVVSMPPPSSGGTHVIEILNLVENDPLNNWGPLSAKAIHLTASAMQQAFADRATHMGDPDFVPNLPIERLTAKSYAKQVRNSMSQDHARKSADVQAGRFEKAESTDTTHLSLMDDEGNVVVSTQTINGWMGSGLVVTGTGILMNNEMDDFSAKPGAANQFGAVGSVANAVAPQKTPLSSMAPTIFLKEGRPVLALGAPGGTRIITCVAQTALNYLEYGLPLYESVSMLRFHHQWQPDQLDLEKPGPGDEVVQSLERMGYMVHLTSIPCRVNAVAREGFFLRGVADPRDLGSTLGR